MQGRSQHQIVRADSCLSALQQRLKYARSVLKGPVSYFVENVPVWPAEDRPEVSTPRQEMFEYADCNGSPHLLEAIRLRDNAKYGLALSGEDILITNGGMHALSLVFRQVNSMGSKASAVCLAPVFGAVPALLGATGYTVHYYHMRTQTPAVDEILALCQPDTKLVYLNFPHNPLGGIYTDVFMQTLVPALAARGIALVQDMVYDSFIFDDQKIISPFSCTSDYSLIYTINSMSKNYGAPGLRVGWITSATANIEAMAGVLETECVAICSPAQAKAASLIGQGNAPLHQQVAKSRSIVHKFLKEQMPGYTSLPPAGTQVFVNLPVSNVENFADQMLGEYGLVLATASNYAGSKGSQIRIPTGYSETATRNALNLLSEGMARYAD